MTIRFDSERVTVISLHDENKDFYRGKKISAAMTLIAWTFIWAVISDM